ncbi:outer membrane transport energization protein TonB [Cupriavidus sp. YR651]|uniref:energy transducer TonB n=1 Tax=Cupriavidus sp. YR651 TaxID=1855315 RepID=UPI00088A65B1|nr:energy transducer TonB [Cupriavidus sp. YR651]SDC11959.1 outer membrane transport energization protein TonB [Cupriavidus sp. YR651]
MFDQRFFKITVAVLLFHAGLLYLVQSGLARKLTEAVISPEIIARIIPLEPPQQPPAPEPPKPRPETPPKQVKVVTPRPTPPRPQPTPEPVASLPPTPTAISAPPSPPAPPAPAPETAAPAAPANAAPRAVGIGEIACSPPQVAYPSQSRRMGETGKAVVRLTTDEGGHVVKTAVVTSSGSSRLDQAAVDAVQKMRCKPYMDNGRAVAVTAQQPINFELN